MTYPNQHYIELFTPVGQGIDGGQPNADRMVRAIEQELHGNTINALVVNGFDFSVWDVVESDLTPVPDPKIGTSGGLGYWLNVQDFSGPSFEFTFWRTQMELDAENLFRQTVDSEAVQYHTQQQSNIASKYETQLTNWENAGFPGGAIPPVVQSRWDKVLDGAAGTLDSYVYSVDLSSTRRFTVADVVETGKVMVLSLRAHLYMELEEDTLSEYALEQIKGTSLGAAETEDPFGFLDKKIQTFNDALPDHTDANPVRSGLLQRWEIMPIDTPTTGWIDDLGLTEV